jgi:hypothetical protein
MLLENPTIRVLCGLGVATLLYIYYTRNADIERRIAALGGRCRCLTAWLPFGIDLIWMDVRSAMTHTNMELWQKCFVKYGKGQHTVEATVMGQRIIFTDDPENIKAILGTQFDDFGESCN